MLHLRGGDEVYGSRAQPPALADLGEQDARDRERAEAACGDRGRQRDGDHLVDGLDQLLDRHHGRDRDGDVVERLGAEIGERHQPPVRALRRQQAARQPGHHGHDRDAEPKGLADLMELVRQVEHVDEDAEAQHAGGRHRGRRQRDPQGAHGFAEARRGGFGAAAADPQGDLPDRPVKQGQQHQQRRQGQPLPIVEPVPGCGRKVGRERHDRAVIGRQFAADGQPQARAEQARRPLEQRVGEGRPAARPDPIADLAGLQAQHLGAFHRGVEVIEQFVLRATLRRDVGGLGRRVGVGFRAELRQPGFGRIDPGGEFRRHGRHLDRDRIDVGPQGLQLRVRQVVARQTRLDPVDHALALVEARLRTDRRLSPDRDDGEEQDGQNGGEESRHGTVLARAGARCFEPAG